ncbi:hypothetical protein LCGC14_1644970 [marine sediment metagenome]|uniref:Uncharacterized protein n=1 Tax=marine sediment metagenome TaxID=412755 RepID=A0A0F9HZ89_9ZZZZ
MVETFEQYYADKFEYWVDLLTVRIKDRAEAEDRVQDIFTGLITRKDFCEGLIEKGEMDDYIGDAIGRQRAQVYREKQRQVPTTSIDPDNIDFLSSIRDNRVGMRLCYDGVELNDFYETAIKCLVGGRKLPGGSFETVGELRQYIFIQYCQNGRTFKEIGELVGLSLQNIAVHYKRIVTILTPTIERFIGRGLNDGELT